MGDIWKFQRRVHQWIMTCFGVEVGRDTVERGDRFLEEALELVQAAGHSKERVLSLVEYVYNRPVGEVSQEVGGVMNTLAAFCNAHNVEMEYAAYQEMDRVEKPDMMAKIKAKHAGKPKGSALPQ